MIYYFVKKRHKYTVSHWLAYYKNELKDILEIVPYDCSSKKLNIEKNSIMIFSDIERLTASDKIKLKPLLNALRHQKTPILNDPETSMKRYELQKSLNNNFNVYRANENLNAIKFPVFLRQEDDHNGNMTPLIHNQSNLNIALKKFPDSLIVEYIDTSDTDGVFRKYSVYRLGDDFLPRHILFSKNWMLKEVDIYDTSFFEEEKEFILTNPHKDVLIDIFNIANIQYGRVDYSFYKGKIQVWEINTNPTLMTSNLSKITARREILEISAQQINNTLKALNRSNSEEETFHYQSLKHCIKDRSLNEYYNAIKRKLENLLHRKL